MERKIKRAVIISGAPDPDIAFLKKEINPYTDYIITADAGLDACTAAGFSPDLAVGDFDTCTPPAEMKNIVRLPAEKDWTDTQHACIVAAEKGFEEVCLYCAAGSRIDHTYANFLSLHFLFSKGIAASLHTPNSVCFYANHNLTVPKSSFCYLTLFACFSEVRDLTLRGVKYPLTNHLLLPQSLLCVSNEITDAAASVTFSEGTLLLLLTND